MTAAVEPGWVNDLAFSPDGTRAYVAGENRLLVLGTATLTVTASLLAGHSPADVELSADGTRVYVRDAMGYLFSFDTTTHTRLAWVQLPGSHKGLALSSDGSRLYTTQYQPAGVLVLDAATLAAVGMVPLDFLPLDVEISAGGDRLYVTGVVPGGQEGRLAVADTATRTVVTTVVFGPYPRALAVTPSASPPPPPAAPVIEGATFYTDGTSARSGIAPGVRISVFTSSRVPGISYRLVLSRDGCRTVLAVLNASARFANASGVIGSTGGTVPPGTPSDRYQVCFRAPVGSGSTITAPVTLDVA